jgi:putative membrane protein
MTDFIPYCGSPPFPGQVAWNTDPILATLLVISFAVSLRFLMSFHASRSQLGCLIAGWIVLSFALMSPLCNLSVALFTARAAQHVTIAFIATPLIARSGLPAKTAASLLYGRTGAKSGLFNPGPYIFALVFWFWHSGAPYDLTLQNNKVYWIMQLSIILCSIALWAALFDESPLNRLHFFVASIFTGLQMSFLGALLTLSGTSWFSVYQNTTWPWGLTPLGDQQLGGALMWTAGGVLLAALLLYSFARLFAQMELRTSH